MLHDVQYDNCAVFPRFHGNVGGIDKPDFVCYTLGRNSIVASNLGAGVVFRLLGWVGSGEPSPRNNSILFPHCAKEKPNPLPDAPRFEAIIFTPRISRSETPEEKLSI